MRTIVGWMVAYLFRWLPHSVTTGLFPVGTPDETSPVIVTGNFSLTVRRVKRAVQGHDVWLVVVNTRGINVWCAATGGILTAQRVIDTIKVSRLARQVSHRQLILPALCAPGVDTEAIRKETGFRARFGPVYARDIPEYVVSGQKKTVSMSRFDFGLRHRLDMLLAMNFPIYLFLAVAVAILWPGHLIGVTVLFWSAVAFLYLFLNLIPGKTGWRQAIASATLVVGVWIGLDWCVLGTPLAHGGWLVATYAIFFGAGLDLAGIASARASDAEMTMHRLRFQRFGRIFTGRDSGKVALDGGTCGGCGTCMEICPVGVFGVPDAARKTTLSSPDACFGCGACVRQCPTGALSLSGP